MFSSRRSFRSTSWTSHRRISQGVHLRELDVLVFQVRVVLTNLGRRGPLQEQSADVAHREATARKDGFATENAIIGDELALPRFEAACLILGVAGHVEARARQRSEG